MVTPQIQHVVAGPGCGKTSMLVKTVIDLVENDHINPNEILILSLTNRNVESIAAKLNQLASKKNIDIHKFNLTTIHGLANRIVTEYDGIINIIEEHEWPIVQNLLPTSNETATRSKGSSTINNKLRNLETMVRWYKNGLHTKTFGPRHLDPLEENTVKQTIEILDNCNMMTNDDLITRAVHLLKDGAIEQSHYRMILLDDLQDFYPSLLPFIKKLISDKTKLLCFSDRNQGIYKFMGDNTSVMVDLDETTQNTAKMILNQNFRNSPEILKASQRVISWSPNYINTELISSKPLSNVDPQYYHFNDPLKQLEFIVSEICQLISTGVVKFNDIAILSRTNAFLNQLKKHLDSYGIPNEKLLSRPEWVNDERIQFILNVCKIMVWADHKPAKCNSSVLFILSKLRGIGTKSLQSLYNSSQQANIPLWQYITTIPIPSWDSSITNKNKIKKYVSSIEGHIPGDPNDVTVNKFLNAINNLIIDLDSPLFKYESQDSLNLFKTNFKQMMKSLRDCQKSISSETPLLPTFLETYLQHDPFKSLNKTFSDTGAEPKDCVKLSTVHSAKGLEFPIVFLANQPPLNLSTDFPMDTNILYVGMTRARNLLYLCNINHPCIRPHQFLPQKNIALNEGFWDYYIKDTTGCLLNSGTRNDNSLIRKSNQTYSLERVRFNQKLIQNTFGIRFFSSLATIYSCVNRKLYK